MSESKEIQDTLNIGIDAKEVNKENSSSEEIIKTKQIGKTPFVLTMIDEEGKGCIAIGQYKLQDEPVTMKEAETITGGEDWKFMIAVIGAITDQIVRTYKGELINE